MRVLRQNIGWILAYGVLLFLAFNRHSHDTGFNYHNELWSDKSGYYVYLPATFIYQFDTQQLPENIDSLTGTGFAVRDGKILTKYPMGVAILQLPFFLSSHVVATVGDYDSNGFSLPYQKMTLVAAVTYFVIALRLLWPWLLSFAGSRWAAGGLTFIVLGTNLVYYVVFESGLSHVYSFFLFSILIYQMHRNVKLGWIILVLSLTISVRYTNALVLLPLYFLRTDQFRFRLQKTDLLPIVLAGIPFLLQLLYNQYAFNSTSLDSYQDEGFLYWMKPKVGVVWFAPENGLFLYTPFWLVLIYSQFRRLSAPLSRSNLTVFGILTLLYASWWSPELGCAFSHRGFTEYLPFFLPGFLTLRTRLRPSGKTVLLGLSVLFTLYTLKLIFSYDYCFHGTDAWDWDFYIRLLSSKLK
jgi:hypothetical protein